MSTPNKSIRHAIVALHLPKKIPDVIVYTSNIAQKMTNNPHSTAPARAGGLTFPPELADEKV